MVGGHRPSTEINLALLANAEGEMRALSVHALGDGGVAIGSTIAALMGFMYPDAPRELVDYDVVNHAPPGKPFRGPGGPVACWALEQAVDEMAYRLDVDPLALRRQWTPHPLHQSLYNWAETISAWQDRPPIAADQGRFRRGVGMAAAHWFYFFHAQTKVEVSSTPEGLMATTATQDMGTGARTVIAQAVADVFGLSLADITVRIGDSNAVRGPLSGGSRTTASIYWPARRAAEEVHAKLVAIAGDHFDWLYAKPVPGGIDHAYGHVPWSEIFQAVPPQTAIVGRGQDQGLPAMPLAFGADSIRTGRGLTGAIHIAEVEVDTRLGRVRPLRIWGGLAVGHIVAPVLARSQCYGGVIQGLGYALYEERRLDLATGHTLSANLEDYRIPGLGDIPEIEIHFIEEGFEHVKGQGVGLSELSTLPVAASIGNAVFQATGWRPHQLPIRPEQIIQEVGS